MAPDAAERGTPQSAPPIQPIPRQSVGVATFNVFRQLTPPGRCCPTPAPWPPTRPSTSSAGRRAGTARRSSPTCSRAAGRPSASRRARRSWPCRGGARSSSSWAPTSAWSPAACPTRTGRYPFGDRYAIRVTLRDRDTGELISVLDTHLPQAIENLDKPGPLAADVQLGAGPGAAVPVRADVGPGARALGDRHRRLQRRCPRRVARSPPRRAVADVRRPRRVVVLRARQEHLRDPPDQRTPDRLRVRRPQGRAPGADRASSTSARSPVSTATTGRCWSGSRLT